MANDNGRHLLLCHATARVCGTREDDGLAGETLVE
jgi:hypothetical protein